MKRNPKRFWKITHVDFNGRENIITILTNNPERDARGCYANLRTKEFRSQQQAGRDGRGKTYEAGPEIVIQG